MNMNDLLESIQKSLEAELEETEKDIWKTLDKLLETHGGEKK